MRTGGPLRTMLRTVLLAWVLVFAPRLFAGGAAEDFAAANELYAKGKFADAAALYEKILENNGQSSALLFNCGNAEFKAGHLGRAIAAYRKAAALTPRDAELRANLAFVRSQAPGATLPESRWRQWLGSLTLNESAVLTALLVWALFALLVARQLRPALAPKLRGTTRLAAGLVVFFGLLLGLQAANHFNSQEVVVTSAEAMARSGPYEDAQSVFTARDGAELRLLERHDDWVQVAEPSGKIGWFNNRQVELLPGE